MPTQRKHTRAFEKDKQRFLSECKEKEAPCWLCGLPIDYSVSPGSSDDSFNLDHEFPVSKRPELQFDPAGFRPSHRSCNILRGNKDPEISLGTLSRKWY
jgi:hypothetical protein